MLLPPSSLSTPLSSPLSSSHQLLLHFSISECTLTPISSSLSFMAMAVAIDTLRLALDYIPQMQKTIDCLAGGDGRRFQIHRVSVYTTILSHDSEIGRQLNSALDNATIINFSNAKSEPMDWQADPDDDLGDAAVLHHLHQQAATVPLLSSVISQSDRGNAATTLTGSALSASINARTQGRPLSSFHRHSYRISSLDLGIPIRDLHGVGIASIMPAFFPYDEQDPFDFFLPLWDPFPLIVWADPDRNNQLVFGQMQMDVVDLFSRRLPTSRPPKRRRTAFNQFLQVSHPPVVEDTSRGNPLPHAKRFNGVRHRPDRNIWVAEMKPHKHKTKQDFGNFKSEDEAARAVDAAFHHYGRPDLLIFPHSSLKFLSTRPAAPAGLDEKAKVKFVKEEAKLLLAVTTASSQLRSTHSSSLQILDLSASPRCCPSGPFRSLSEISSPFNCNGPDEVDDAVSQPQPWMLLDSISTIGVLTNLETLNSLQNAEQGWNWAEDSCALAAPPNVVNSSAYESSSMWLESIIRSSPAPTYPRSPSSSHFQEEIANALLEHQGI